MDVFEQQRRHLKRHINDVIAPAVLEAKKAEFTKKVNDIVDEAWKNPRLISSLKKNIEEEITEQIYCYFRTKEFRTQCRIKAKEMLK